MGISALNETTLVNLPFVPLLEPSIKIRSYNPSTCKNLLSLMPIQSQTSTDPPAQSNATLVICTKSTYPEMLFDCSAAKPNANKSFPSNNTHSHMIIRTPLTHRQPFDTITLRPRPPPRAQTRSMIIRAHGAAARLLVQSTAQQQPHGGPRGGDVDDRVPEPHQGEDDAGSVAEGEGDEGWVDEGVDSVDG